MTQPSSYTSFYTCNKIQLTLTNLHNYYPIQSMVIVIRRQLADGGAEPIEGVGKVGTTGEDFGEGGSG